MSVLTADRWLYETITGDAQLHATLGNRVFVDNAPLGTSYPLAVMTFVTANQISNVSADRVADNELWQVALWTDEPNYTSIESVANRLRAVLHKASGAGVLSCAFETQTRMSDADGYKAIILEFRLFTQ